MKMKLRSMLLITLTLCLCAAALCACSGDDVKDPGMEAVASAVFGSFDTDDLAQIPDAYVENIMQIPLNGYVSRNTVISAVDTNIDEYGIFQGKDEAQTAELKAALENYLEYRQELWMDDNLPEEKLKLDSAEVWVEGNYVMYEILSDADREAVYSAFTGCFEG